MATIKPERIKTNKKNELPFESLNDKQKKIYSDIEHAIIVWNLDGTKTAGTLTRRIMKKLVSHKILDVSKKNGKKTNK